MKLLHKDVGAGTLRLQVDTLDDLWTLRNLIRPGDLVEADTFRTAEDSSDKVRAEKLPKKRMRLGIRAVQVEWHDFDDHLRVLGPIETGPQEHGRHHTHIFRDEPGTQLVIHKPGPLEPWQLRAVRDAEEATHRPRVILLAIDDSEAQFATLTAYGVQYLGTITGVGQGKRFDGAAAAKKSYYDEVTRSLLAQRPNPATPLLVVGPGWWREEFIDHLAQKAPDQAKTARTDGTSQAGRNGIHEALRRGMLAQVDRDHRLAEDTDLVERLLASIARGDRLSAYGPAEVTGAINASAVEVVLASDVVVREGTMDTVLATAEQARARIHIIATGHSSGTQLHRLGGIAALLRFAYP